MGTSRARKIAARERVCAAVACRKKPPAGPGDEAVLGRKNSALGEALRALRIDGRLEPGVKRPEHASADFSAEDFAERSAPTRRAT